MAFITIRDVKNKNNCRKVTINTKEISELVEVEEEEWCNVCGWADFFGPEKVKCTNINMNSGNSYQVRDTRKETEDKIKEVEKASVVPTQNNDEHSL